MHIQFLFVFLQHLLSHNEQPCQITIILASQLHAYSNHSTYNLYQFLSRLVLQIVQYKMSPLKTKNKTKKRVLVLSCAHYILTPSV